ncbi:MAG: iron ABC transporter substrate-binding protein [Acidimicrobiia bacterium]
MRHFRTVVALATCALVVVVTASNAFAASPTKAPEQRAKKPSGTIVVYSGRNEALVKPIIDEFTADTGIDVEVRYGDSGALASQVLTEADASPADVFFSQDAGALGALTKEKLFVALPKAITDLVAPEYRAEDRTWVGLSGRVRVLVFNPKLVPDPPDTIDALVDPEWKGKLGFAPTNASWQAFVTGLRVLRGEVKAEKWLRGFAANEPKAYSNNGAVRDAVNAGQISLGLVNHYYLWQRITVEGEANVTARNQYMAAGDPGGLVNVAGAAVMKSSDNKAAARAFVEYMLGKDAQEYFAESTFEYPLVAGAQPSVKLPKLTTLEPPAVDLSDLDTLAATQELLVKVKLLTR